MSIKILTDSGSDLTPELCEKYDVSIMPLTVLMGDKEYADGQDVSSQALMTFIEDGGIPKTSQVKPQVMEDTFIHLSQDYGEVIYITLSSNLSGTYNTAKLVHNQLLERGRCHNLTIIDSKSATLGQGLLVMSVAEMVKNNHKKEHIIRAIDVMLKKVNHRFTVSDLTHLYNGGRLTKTQAYFGNILNISPIMTLEDGRIEVKDKVRGKKKSYNKLLFELVNSRELIEDRVIAINHSGNEDGVEYLVREIRHIAEPKEIIVNHVGCAIGAHTGPSYIGIYYMEL